MAEFFGALDDMEQGRVVTHRWSATARRLHDDFRTSVGFVNGKRCLGGFLELLCHCHFVVAAEGADLGWPEVTLPVVPGMEGCHWPLRKARPEDRSRLLAMLLSGRPVKAADARGWLVDFAGPLDEAVRAAWRFASGEGKAREVEAGALEGVPADVPGVPEAGSAATIAARKAIRDTVARSCAVGLSEALAVQADLAADFLASKECRNGAVGADRARTMDV